MTVAEAGPDDVPELARLLWANEFGDGAPPVRDPFVAQFAAWWDAHRRTHTAFVARVDAATLAGMAWIALVARPPRPAAPDRLAADLQSVFVEPPYRGRGVGSALVDAACEHAVRLGASFVTVHSGRRAVPLYERRGFASSRELLMRSPDGAAPSS